MNIPHILGERQGKKTLSVMLKSHTYVIDDSNPQFQMAVDALESGDLDALEEALDLRKAIVKQSMGELVLDDKTILYKGKPLNHSLVSRIISMFSKGKDVKPLLAFLNNLLQNPSYRAVNELYGFLNACSLPLTEDGHFMAYKKVQDNYFDIYTGTMDNSIGKTVSMERHEVNEDCEQTCSQGLHVCSESYLQHYGTGGGSRVVLVKINPRDVVAVPVDYDNAKMRVCQYDVIGEMEDYQDTLEDDFTTDYSDVEEDYQEGFDEIDVALETPTEENFVESSDGLQRENSFEETVELDDEDFNELLDEWDKELDSLVDDKSLDDKFEQNMGQTFEDTVEDMVDNTGGQLELDMPIKPRPTSTKLTEGNVYDVHSMYKDGWTLVAIGEAVNISPRQVGRIVRGEAWADIYYKVYGKRP